MTTSSMFYYISSGGNQSSIFNSHLRLLMDVYLGLVNGDLCLLLRLVLYLLRRTAMLYWNFGFLVCYIMVLCCIKSSFLSVISGISLWYKYVAIFSVYCDLNLIRSSKLYCSDSIWPVCGRKATDYGVHITLSFCDVAFSLPKLVASTIYWLFVIGDFKHKCLGT